ncbi:transcriptional regulator [Cellulomonas hominis]|uniref:Transcriptional regulator n=1 Tax=Cellulomonas hominis TaxID=156981 RepID=A0A511FG18_9CELL|nr:metalloregulator ArsR/SmtB family transcription factor [Cellulomonas hominis]MBB5475129.1 ArsR family transcriptional regulator [Cellulomonas hominis]NKY11607.1 helix-turn-helix transcriptional regulator [Cellulomonas hominis]GEL48161.1 transcriptional regulator [Cellulomonas hominis]
MDTSSAAAGAPPSVGSPAPTPLHTALSREQAESTASLLRVVSDPTRLQLLSLMHHSENGEACVSDLARALGFRQPTVTYHLKVLADAGVVTREPRGRQVWCSILPDRLAAIGDLLR